MDILKKIFPFSFVKMESVANLVIGIIIYVVVGIVAAAIVALTSALAAFVAPWIPSVIEYFLTLPFGILGTIVDVYVIAGIVIKILVYTKVIKDQ